jgi:hypothetical protein
MAYDRAFVELRPYQLMDIVARIGAGMGPDLGDEKLTQVLQCVRADPLTPIRLRCNVDGIYRFQNPGREDDTPEGALFNERRDLTILQKLGMVPGDTRPAISLFHCLIDRVETAQSVCGKPRPGSPTWSGSDQATDGHYEKGRAMGLDAIIPPRPADEMAQVKCDSAAQTLATDHLQLRPHHAMCMSCFYGRHKLEGKPLVPIDPDNLYEAIIAVQRDPQLPVTLVRGPCMICPPCGLFDPKTGMCIGGRSMSLRDQKKDLDVLYRLDMAYGDTLPAYDYFHRLYCEIEITTEICGNENGVETAPEWSICCGPAGCAGYIEAREDGLGIPGLADALAALPGVARRN